MKFSPRRIPVFFVLTLSVFCSAAVAADEPAASNKSSQSAAKGPLRVDPRNPRYFTDGAGNVVYLTGSHTWANLQDQGAHDPPPKFDYDRYLDFLQEHNHNFIRMWAWENVRWSPLSDGKAWADGKASRPTDWYIEPNPYARTGPGMARDGKPKFDLTKFDPAYFDRLRQRVQKAGERGIYVSIMLFQGCSSSLKHWGLDGEPWPGHPYYPENNIQAFNGNLRSDVGPDRNDPHVREREAEYIRKVVDTVNDLDNVLYEVINEGGNKDWDWWVVRTVQEYEKTKAKQHLVGLTAHGSENNEELLASPAAWISPGSDGWPDLKSEPRPAPATKVCLLDTDHVFGTGGDHVWVWKCFLRGYNVLFMDPYDDAEWALLGAQDIGVPDLVGVRQAMGLARRCAQRMNLATSIPQPELASTGYCLATPGKEYLIYLPSRGDVDVHAFDFPGKHPVGDVDVNLSEAPGNFSVEWMHPVTGEVTAGSNVQGGDWRKLTPPIEIEGDAVLYMWAVK